MPFVLIIVGLLLTIAGVRNTHEQLAELLRNDFTGKSNFGYWALSVVAIGSVGYIKEIRPLANWFLALLLIVLLLSNEGFFVKFKAAIEQSLRNPTGPSAAGKDASGGQQ